VILLTLAGREYEPVNNMHRIIEDVMNIPDDNFYSLNGEDHNQSKFEETARAHLIGQLSKN
jgi:hypothetical protein